MKDLGSPGDYFLSMIQACVAAAKKANEILKCINRGIASISQEVIVFSILH